MKMKNNKEIHPAKIFIHSFIYKNNAKRISNLSLTKKDIRKIKIGQTSNILKNISELS